MRKPRRALLPAAADAVALGARALAARPTDTAAGRPAPPRGRGTEVVGAVHVHTTHSDGAGSVVDDVGLYHQPEGEEQRP